MVQTGARRTEDGNILVIALLFTTIFGLIAAALLTQTDASFRNTRNLRDYQAKVYGADAGIEYGIQQLREDNTLCPDSGGSATLPPQQFNGRTVQVTCETLTGSAVGGAGFAVITTATSDGLQTQGGGDKVVDGPVWAADVADSIPNLVIQGGDLYEQASTSGCSDAGTGPDDVTYQPSPPYRYHCSSSGPPVIEHDLPASVPALAPAPVVDGDCTAFLPGRYPAIVLNERNYFASGVYYFENVELYVTGGDQIVGGKAAVDEVQQNPDAACTDDATLGVDDGTGVKFILGGTSRLVADNPGGQIELYRRQGGDEEVEGTQGISIQTVEADDATAGWLPYARPTTDPLVLVGSGTTPQFTVHGMVHAPNALISFSATNTSQAQIRGGVVCHRLILQNAASATGLVVSVNPGTGRRRVLLTSTAQDSEGARDIVSRAVIEIDNTPDRTVVIESWRST